MKDLSFSKQEKEQIVPLLQEFLRDELDCEAGRFEVEFLADFFIRECGGLIYNKALNEAHAHMSKRLEDSADALYELEKVVDFKKR